MELNVCPDLTVTLGQTTTRLSVAEGFDVAQALIRAATRRLVQEEMGLVDADLSAIARKDGNEWDERWGAEDRAVSKS